MPPQPARCRQNRNVDEIMTPEASSRDVGELFAHAASCYPCRLAMLSRRDYPPGCNAPYIGHQAMNYLELLTLSQASPRSNEEGVLGMHELLNEHRAALQSRGVAAELIDHVVDCPACLIDIVSAREGVRQMHRRPAAAPQTEF